jgi:hypothetical protein
VSDLSSTERNQEIAVNKTAWKREFFTLNFLQLLFTKGRAAIQIRIEISVFLIYQFPDLIIAHVPYDVPALSSQLCRNVPVLLKNSPSGPGGALENKPGQQQVSHQ